MEIAYEGGAARPMPADVREYKLFKAHVCAEFVLETCSMCYTDGEGDVVTIANQADLDEAFAYMREAGLGPLRINIKGMKASYAPVVAVTKSTESATVEDAVFALLDLMHEWSIASSEEVTVALKAGFFNILLDAGFVDCWRRMTTDVTNPNHAFASALVNAICTKDLLAAEDLLTQADNLGSMVNQIFHESPQTSQLLATALPALVSHFSAAPVVVPEVVVQEEITEVEDDEEKPSAESTAVHTHRICDGCGMYPLVGVRHQSLKDRNMDFCSSCVQATRYQSFAPFRSIDTELVIHYNIECDGCGIGPLEGIRYKSAVVDDFDLCSLCEETGSWTSHEPFIKIVDPEKAQALKKKSPTSSTAVHQNIVCDGCSKHPIVGARFKSAVVKHFDLCETCEATGSWNESHGPFLKIASVDQTPYALYVATEAMQRHGKGATESEAAFTERVQQDYQQPRCGRGSRRSKSHYGGPFAPFNFGSPPPPFVPPSHHHGRRRSDPPATPYLRCRFVEDVTLPDGSVSAPGQLLSKQWRLENNGDTAWPTGCSVQMVGGVGMEPGAPCAVPALLPGENFVLSLDLQAPMETGRYVCYFRICAPSGSRFGHRFWIDVTVQAPVQPAAPQVEAAEVSKTVDVASLPMATLVLEASDEVSELEAASPAVDDMASSYEYVAEVQDECQDVYAHAAALDELEMMGFADTETNRRLLDAHDGNLERVVELLLE
ncbi:hypothetical protein ACHHYP_14289 [Achlya hypogyna]|uniref:ZZ-type domain-containing protein n=1 Tax=Achlya hypogyna TaxID=1202772 RepID=A0A1V9YDJ1_ACHHY|nr:hypothetical protein ACHHYP_14289 [Achlya hypogyna]